MFVLEIIICIVVGRVDIGAVGLVEVFGREFGQLLAIDILNGLLGVGGHAAYRCNLVATLVEVDEAHTLCGAARHADVGYTQTQGYTRAVDDHQVVFIINAFE